MQFSLARIHRWARAALVFATCVSFAPPAIEQAQRAQKQKPSASARSNSTSSASTTPPRIIVDSSLESTVDAIVQEAIDNHQVPGAVVVVGHDGRVILRKAYGMRSLEPTRERMTLDTIFDVASLTKVMATTLSIMRLVELGQVRLSDPVAKYLPDFGLNGKGDITVRMLLTHYSGLRADIDLKEPWQGYDEALRRIYNDKPIYPPGARFLYSDENFIVLGELVRQLAQMPLDRYATAHFYLPLGMTHTRFTPPAEWRAQIAPTQYETPLGNGTCCVREREEMLRGVVHDP